MMLWFGRLLHQEMINAILAGAAGGDVSGQMLEPDSLLLMTIHAGGIHERCRTGARFCRTL